MLSVEIHLILVAVAIDFVTCSNKFREIEATQN